MELRIYVSKLKDENFDYNIKNQNGDSQYAPNPISTSVSIDTLYWDIFHYVRDHDENTKKTDWGTFVIKLTNKDLINFLSKEKYKKAALPDYWKSIGKEIPSSLDVNGLLNCAKNLEDGEYLLVAQELF
jgi:hypothetical protein